MFQHLSFVIMMVFNMILFSDQLQISVWDGSVLAVHNGNAILPCQFFGGFLSNQIIILWQRVETKEILWSCYHGENQLNQQSLEYSGRVSLFPEELKRGNASLKLENVKLNDTGKYMCSVRTPLENSTGILSLQIAAHYTEPSLRIKQTSNGINFIFESAVSWLKDKLQDISALSVTLCQPGEDGLYSIQSSLLINGSGMNSKFIFTLMNKVLQQSLSWTFELSSGKLIDLSVYRLNLFSQVKT
ncbi:CD276 antigen-like [Chiloscyllium plagiosum]|uniref:CD276 antigen-like n=1 Tax=Chiloscyllium plagiosum TaxID=36176 RepID=UPI001CB834F3|nr:CD276 antigen-like [Chiloscyllium plagiosum]XP_043541804.1 CD276 antigen-like [Chiloscyllium plagiosum]XP_043541805.1 CD276 antigen-like [Chiloscyllium plagiosum]XP_043541806.1 CD276 antigen-like [Chiloscyllium plagiosum]XP_043541807.1 CD276 antigen-like [Chiloscyllium plagiosum]